MNNLDQFLEMWIPATADGTYRAFAWWEGGFGQKNKIAFLPVNRDGSTARDVVKYDDVKAAREADADAVRELVAEHGEVFFYANTFTTTSTKADYAELTTILQLDFDQADPRAIDGVEPSIVWETSQGNFQGLWLLDTPVDRDTRQHLNHALYEIYKEHGADPSYDASRRLRLPGTVNRKPGRDDAIVTVVEVNGTVYSPSELAESAPAPSTWETTAAPTTSDISRDQALAIFKKYGISTKLQQQWSAPVAVKGRSDLLAALLAKMNSVGMTADELFIVGWTATNNKFRDRPEVLWAEVQKVQAKYQPKTAQTKTEGWTTSTGADLLLVDPNIEWIYEAYWPVGVCGIVYGVPGARKSWVVTDFVVSVIGGKDFMGVKNQLGPRNVYVHALDDPLKQFARRIRNVSQALGVTDAEIADRLFWSRSGFSFADDYEAHLREDVRKYQPALIVVDGLYLAGYNSELHGSDLPSKLRAVKEIAAEPPYPAFMIVHHSTKAGTGDDVRIGGAGSIFLSAWGEMAWQLNKLGQNEHGQQVVQLAVDGKFGAAPLPMRLTFGRDPLLYELEYEELELSERTVNSVLQNVPEGMNADDIATLLGHSKAPTTALLKRLLEAGRVEYAKGKWLLKGSY